MSAPRLPDTPSELIRLAVADARALSRERYHPNAQTWHESFGGRCYICDAGAVMAGTLRLDPDSRIDLGTPYCPWTADTHGKLAALDCFRRGFIHHGLVEMGIRPPAGADAMSREAAHSANRNYDNWQEFDAHLEDMERTAAWLEGLGL